MLIAGAGGTLGAALLARALGSGRFAQVQALVSRPLASTLPGFEPLPFEQLGARAHADTAAIVFERERRNNGRDEAYRAAATGAVVRSGAAAARCRRAPAAGGGAARTGAVAAGA